MNSDTVTLLLLNDNEIQVKDGDNNLTLLLNKNGKK
jgi:hypothetical protein